MPKFDWFHCFQAAPPTTIHMNRLRVSLHGLACFVVCRVDETALYLGAKSLPLLPVLSVF